MTRDSIRNFVLAFRLLLVLILLIIWGRNGCSKKVIYEWDAAIGFSPTPPPLKHSHRNGPQTFLQIFRFFYISCGLVEEKESETIGDTAVLSWMTVHRWFASTQSSAATLLLYRAHCTHCAADAHQWFAFTQSHSIYCIRIKLPGNYIPASIQLAFLYFLYDDMKRKSSIAIWISLVIIHISQPRSQRNIVQQCN